MFFADLLPSDAEREKYKKVCSDFSAFLKDCLDCLIESYKAAGLAGGQSEKAYHATILLLTRHVIEYIDGVVVHVSQGVSQPCLPLLRSALEATLGIKYILEADTERRALAYQVAHAHRKMKFWDRLDPTTVAGKELRNYLGADADAIFNQMPLESHLLILDRRKQLTGLLANADFGPIEQEWQTCKKTYKKEPEWYALFGGPKNARELAQRVGWACMYDFCYQHWSNEVHAGSAMDAAGVSEGKGVFRPFRHPDELQASLVHASNFTTDLSMLLLRAYAPEKVPELQRTYIEKIQKRKGNLLNKKLITAPWKDAE
jgi:hypothetical protein